MRVVAFKTSQVALHMLVAFAVGYAFTGSLAVGGAAAVVEPICNVTLMPLHDKLWARFSKQRNAQVVESKDVMRGALASTTPAGAGV